MEPQFPKAEHLNKQENKLEEAEEEMKLLVAYLPSFLISSLAEC